MTATPWPAHKDRVEVGEDTTRQNDMFEVMLHVHGLQNMVLSQAAPRLYPDRYRGMGTRITSPGSGRTEGAGS